MMQQHWFSSISFVQCIRFFWCNWCNSLPMRRGGRDSSWIWASIEWAKNLFGCRNFCSTLTVFTQNPLNFLFSPKQSLWSSKSSKQSRILYFNKYLGLFEPHISIKSCWSNLVCWDCSWIWASIEWAKILFGCWSFCLTLTVFTKNPWIFYFLQNSPCSFPNYQNSPSFCIFYKYLGLFEPRISIKSCWSKFICINAWYYY